MEDIYKELKVKFDQHTGQKVNDKLTSTSPSDECYNKTINVFYQECTGNQVSKSKTHNVDDRSVNPGFPETKRLLGK